MKKVLSIILCLTTLSLCTVSVSATSVQTESVSESESQRCHFITSTEIPDNTVRLYKSGTGFVLSAYIEVMNAKTSETTKINMPSSYYVDTYFPEQSYYYLYSNFDETGGLCRGSFRFDKTGGKYRLVNLKLSDFSDYFNEDGTHTATIFDETHDYNFTDEGDFKSLLLFVSGGAMTYAVPKSNGYCNVYITTDIGCDVFVEPFYYKATTSPYVGFTDNTNSEKLKGLKVGDAYYDNTVNVTDATYIQKCISELETPEDDTLTTFRTDANGDGVINVADATAIQKYIADID